MGELDLIDLSPVKEKVEIEDKSELFSFWGASKKLPKGAGAKEAPSSRDEIAIADKAKLLEANDSKDTTTSLKASATSMKASAITKKPVGGKIADRLKAFESAKEVIAPLPPPPPPSPPPPAKEDKKKSKSSSKKEKEIIEEPPTPPKKTSKNKAVPGSFPTDFLDEDIVEVVEMPTAKKSSKSKSASKSKEIPKEVPKEEPVVDTPPTPPPEPKSSKKERPRVVRDGSSWGAWGAAPREEKKKSSKDRKSSPSDEKKASKDSKSKRADKEEKGSSKDSSSDKADRPPISRGLTSMFGVAPPLRRSSTSGKTSSRRHSVVDSGLVSPPPEMSAKAAKMLGKSNGLPETERRQRMPMSP